MAHNVILGKHIIGTVGADNKVNYDMDRVKSVVTEMVAGQSGKGGFFTTAKVVYKWDRNRKTNNDEIYNLWKINPILQNRITQLNALTFGRGLKWIYEDNAQVIINRFWRINRIMSKLNSMSTDSQLYGEIFIGLYPQPTGDVLIGIYESSQVDIDFSPGNVYDINKYIITYKDEESGKDEQFDMMPIEKYLNELEFQSMVGAGKVTTRKGKLGLNGMAKVKGKGVMAHIKFNNSSAEVHGTSDFKQIFDILPSYMDFISDRMTIHQMYGSPAYDITIDTDDAEVITNRINELAGFRIGSNPVHNKAEEWKPLQFTSGGGIPAGSDEKMLRGLLCAGTGFPEHLLFNQSDQANDNTFALIKIAEDRQDTFGEALQDIHRFVVAIAGGDPTVIDEGQLIFPEINTMSEKSKAETYVLKVGAKICSRKTAAMNMGHNYDIEFDQILEEEETLGSLMDNNSMAGAIGGRFTSRQNNQNPNRDDGSDDRESRSNANNISSQVMGDRKTND